MGRSFFIAQSQYCDAKPRSFGINGDCWSMVGISISHITFYWHRRLTATELKKFMLCATIPWIYISFELIIYRLSGDVDKPRHPVLSQESLTQWWERPNFNAGQHWSCPLSKIERGYLRSGRMCLCRHKHVKNFVPCWVRIRGSISWATVADDISVCVVDFDTVWEMRPCGLPPIKMLHDRLTLLPHSNRLSPTNRPALPKIVYRVPKL